MGRADPRHRSPAAPSSSIRRLSAFPQPEPEFAAEIPLDQWPGPPVFQIPCRFDFPQRLLFSQKRREQDHLVHLPGILRVVDQRAEPAHRDADDPHVLPARAAGRQDDVLLQAPRGRLVLVVAEVQIRGDQLCVRPALAGDFKKPLPLNSSTRLQRPRQEHDQFRATRPATNERPHGDPSLPRKQRAGWEKAARKSAKSRFIAKP